jgi:hypothetical protein
MKFLLDPKKFMFEVLNLNLTRFSLKPRLLITFI